MTSTDAATAFLDEWLAGHESHLREGLEKAFATFETTIRADERRLCVEVARGNADGLGPR